jgi:hypothetical protein
MIELPNKIGLGSGHKKLSEVKGGKKSLNSRA